LPTTTKKETQFHPIYEKKKWNLDKKKLPYLQTPKIIERASREKEGREKGPFDIYNTTIILTYNQ